MPRFGSRSKRNLKQAHPLLQKLFNEVIKHFDCSVICGHRNKKDQNDAYHSGMSDLLWPDGNHNKRPSTAVDVVPYRIRWHDPDPKQRKLYRARMYFFAGFVKGVALNMGMKIRWGGDWDSDTQVNDHEFIDLPHFELELKKTRRAP